MNRYTIRALAIVAAATSPVLSRPAYSQPATARDTGFLSADATIGDIMRTPGGVAVLKKHKPALIENDEINLLLTLPLRGVWGWFPGFTADELRQIDSELKLVPAPPVDPTGPIADPPHRAQKLALKGLPKGVGERVSLFNGRDLTGWDTWLGPDDSDKTTRQALGLNNDPKGMFTVREVDGAPAIRSDGKIWGVMVTKGEFSNYHLHIEYKWGEHAGGPRNNGVLYHSFGPYGALNQQWMNSIELEMIPGQIAGVNQVGGKVHFRTTVGRDPKLNSTTKRQFMLGGREVEIGFKGFEFIQGMSDAEQPIGQWNSIDLYVFGDAAVHVVNGIPVLSVHGMTTGKERSPLDHGRIQLQSEGAETFFRNVTMQPIEKLPRIVIAR